MSVKDITKDITVGVIAGAATLNPVSSALFQAYDAITTNVFKRRFELWKQLVDERLSQLEDHVREAANNDSCFATVLLRATQLAAETSTEKMEYLANAVRFVAENKISEDRIVIFLNCLQKYTSSHFLILGYFQNPAKYADQVKHLSFVAGSIMTYFDKAYPSFDKSLQSIIIRDLFLDGFTNTDSNGTVSANGMKEKRTTVLGDEFLHFCGIGETAL